MNKAANIKLPKNIRRTGLLMAVCALALTMCVPGGGAPEATPTLGIPEGRAYACLPRHTQLDRGVVEEVVDGDTIRVALRGESYAVRYIGIDTPETHHPYRGEEPYGAQAAERNRQMVEGQTVTLVRDVSETDQYDRLLRYVLVGDVFVNAKLVAEGYARAVTFPPDIACKGVFAAAEDRARTENWGLWGLPTAAPP